MPFQSALQPLFEVILTAVRRSAAMGQWVKKNVHLHMFRAFPEKACNCIFQLFVSWSVRICLHLRSFGHSLKKLVIALLMQISELMRHNLLASTTFRALPEKACDCISPSICFHFWEARWRDTSPARACKSCSAEKVAVHLIEWVRGKS